MTFHEHDIASIESSFDADWKRMSQPSARDPYEVGWTAMSVFGAMNVLGLMDAREGRAALARAARGYASVFRHPYHRTTAPAWRLAMLTSILTRNNDTNGGDDERAFLTTIDGESLRERSAGSDVAFLPYVDAVAAHVRGDANDAAEKTARALEVARASTAEFRHGADMLAPELACFAAIASADVAASNAALHDVLAGHRRLHSQKSFRNYGEGFFALGAAALVVWGRERGMSDVDCVTEYVPRWIIDES